MSKGVNYSELESRMVYIAEQVLDATRPAWELDKTQKNLIETSYICGELVSSLDGALYAAGKAELPITPEIFSLAKEFTDSVPGEDEHRFLTDRLSNLNVVSIAAS